MAVELLPLESNVGTTQERAAAFIRVEFDTSSAGPGHCMTGDFAYIPIDSLDGTVETVEKAFTQITGQPSSRIIQFSPDEIFSASGMRLA